MKLRVILTVVLAVASVGTRGQSLEELRAQMNRAQQELKATNALLGDTDNKITASERTRRLTENKIAAQRKIIANYEKQAQILSGEINSNSQQITELGSSLEALKEDYARVVLLSWKNHRLNNAMTFLFASRNFNDATRRMAHMKRYNHRRLQQAAEIDSVSRALQHQTETLATRKQELDQAQSRQKDQIEELSKSQSQLSSIISDLRGDRKRLEAKAKDQKARIANAQKQIDKIIAQQARAAQNERKNQSQSQRQKDVALSGKFEENKGKLPWPVEGGSVLHHFGKQTVSANITSDFKGIEIAAPAGAAVTAVFEGEVTGIYKMEHFNTCVTVRSGDFIVLYGNLASVAVKSGAKVAVGQRLGALTTGSEGPMLVFQIWRETTPVDPILWLRK
ncbi:MAG: peptidoglycan DD-metalloendopeptidase family protein [Rikenellaceae bacterium]|jgi:septal ring factor EnvC (AmiA/AmiB activator)|nr:peptidoglycan DD-metalloendopeptidase family protein [Rikenellaceae bacterium]